MAKDEAKWTYWGKHINAWQASGLSRHVYCQREGLKPTTFDYWRPLIASDHAELKPAKQVVRGNDITLVPVALAPGGPRPAAHPVGQSLAVDFPRGEASLDAMALGQSLNLKSPSGWEMRVPANIEPNWLITILRQLA